MWYVANLFRPDDVILPDAIAGSDGPAFIKGRASGPMERFSFPDQIPFIALQTTMSPRTRNKHRTTARRSRPYMSPRVRKIKSGKRSSRRASPSKAYFPGEVIARPILWLIIYLACNPAIAAILLKDPDKHLRLCLGDLQRRGAWRYTKEETDEALQDLLADSGLLRLLRRLLPCFKTMNRDQLSREIAKWDHPPCGQVKTMAYNARDKVFAGERAQWSQDLMELFHHPMIGGPPLSFDDQDDGDMGYR